MSPLAPIALFVYQRIHETTITVNALKNNELAPESDLFIFSDAARTDASAANVAMVREYLKSIDGFKSVTVIERERNLGLSQSIVSGVGDLTGRFGKVIVVEDDLETSRYFLRFMNEGLNAYKDDTRVISIHGYVYPVHGDLPQTFFLRGADCWGWATWKRGWDLYHPDGKQLLEQLKQQRSTNDFDFNDSYPYTRMLKQQIKGKNDSWAVRWYASAFLSNALTLYPGRSLVNNISSDHLGTHTKQLPAFQAELSSAPIPVETIPVEDHTDARKHFERFFRSIHQPVHIKLLNRLRTLLG